MKKNHYFAAVCLIFITTFCSFTAHPSQFISDYQEARDDFSRLLSEIPGPGVFGSIPLENGLAVDWYLYNDSPTLKKNLIIITSGLHGIEGAFGSWLQRSLLNDLKDNKLLLQNTSILFLHILNPWGMKNHRRVNQDNIDLNRSFFSTAERPTNPSYPLFSNLINPQEKASVNLLSRIQFWFKVAYQFLSHGQKKLRQAVLQGQYAEPKGLFYGGQKKGPLQNALETFLTPLLLERTRLFLFDIHTGFGKRGSLHLFSGNVSASRREEFQRYFPENPVDWNDSKDFYQTNGDLLNWFIDFAPRNITCIPITLEFGTKDSQTTVGSIISLETVSLENQLFHFGAVSTEDANKIRELYLELFSPSSPDWKNSVHATGMLFLKNQLEFIDRL